MRMQVLVAAMHASGEALAETMNLQTDAIIVNQCDTYSYEEFDRKGHKIRMFSMAERGVGLSRNTALMRADADIVLFSDEDIRYVDGYEEIILKAFSENPDADGMTFNLTVDPRRKTYENTEKKRIRFYNYGRYPTYALAVRRDAVTKARVYFSLLFGGGAKYSNGEDSMFFHDCLKKGLHLYATTETIGEEIYRESTWFKGYNEKFFFDRGVLYAGLYGVLAKVFAIRFLVTKKSTLLADMNFKAAYGLMKKGIQEGKSRKDME